MSVVLAQAAVWTPFGGLDDTWKALMEGRSAGKPVRRFDAGRVDCALAATWDGLDGLGEGNRVQALMEPALAALAPLPKDAAVVWTGIKGNVQDVEERSRGLKGQAVRLARQYRLWTAGRMRLSGAGLEVNAACVSSAVGVALAAQRIADGEWACALVAGADCVSRFTFTGFGSLKALSPTLCRPFHARRDGLMLGDAACALHLCGEAQAQALGLTPLARVAGWGITNDANHITGPARDGRGLVAAIRQAMGQAGWGPDDVEAYCAHATGTNYNDAMELTALETVFGQRRFPLFGVKGSLGHSLGASGGLEAALCAKALAARAVPGTWGLDEPEPRAAGRAQDRPQPFAGRRILTTNSGFGGLNAALLLEAA